MNSDYIRADYKQKTVRELISHYQKNALDLEPGFQRSSVWTEKDRRKLIDSLLRNYPLPSIFLYKKIENGRVIYQAQIQPRSATP